MLRPPYDAWPHETLVVKIGSNNLRRVTAPYIWGVMKLDLPVADDPSAMCQTSPPEKSLGLEDKGLASNFVMCAGRKMLDFPALSATNHLPHNATASTLNPK